MIHVFFAHQLSGPDPLANIEAAGRLMSEIADRIPIVPVASWVTFCRHWDESKRTKGLSVNRAQIARCDEVWLIGPTLTSGMEIETGFARELRVPYFNLVGIPVEAIVSWWQLGRTTRSEPLKVIEMSHVEVAHLHREIGDIPKSHAGPKLLELYRRLDNLLGIEWEDKERKQR